MAQDGDNAKNHNMKQQRNCKNYPNAVFIVKKTDVKCYRACLEEQNPVMGGDIVGPISYVR